MENQKPESLVDEVKANVRRDRDRLEKLQDRLLSSLETLASDDEEGGLNPHALAGVAEGVAMLAGELTRSNSQLVEIIKINSRTSPVGKDGLTKEERGAIFAEIEAVPAHDVDA